MSAVMKSPALRHLAGVADVDPGARPEALHLELEHLGVDSRRRGAPGRSRPGRRAPAGRRGIASWAHCRITQMIVFDLLCGEGHRFEGWFGSAGDFAASAIEAAVLPDLRLRRGQRVPSATRANLGAPEPKPAPAPPSRPRRRTWKARTPSPSRRCSIRACWTSCSPRARTSARNFPAEARKIFYKESPARAIRGQATNEEHEELVDEGIPVARLPRAADRQAELAACRVLGKVLLGLGDVGDRADAALERCRPPSER